MCQESIDEAYVEPIPPGHRHQTNFTLSFSKKKKKKGKKTTEDRKKEEEKGKKNKKGKRRKRKKGKISFTDVDPPFLLFLLLQCTVLVNFISIGKGGSISKVLEAALSNTYEID